MAKRFDSASCGCPAGIQTHMSIWGCTTFLPAVPVPQERIPSSSLLGAVPPISWGVYLHFRTTRISTQWAIRRRDASREQFSGSKLLVYAKLQRETSVSSRPPTRACLSFTVACDASASDLRSLRIHIGVA